MKVLTLMLCGPQPGLWIPQEEGKLGDIWEQLASRQEIITNQPIVGAATLLYLDLDKDRPKRGAASTKRKPGTLRRFVDLIQQLDLTYDLYSMQPTDILGLLPAEFDSWRPLGAASQTAQHQPIDCQHPTLNVGRLPRDA